MRTLEELLLEYDEIKTSFRKYTKTAEVRKNNLIEYQGRFNDLKSDLRTYKNQTLGEWIKRDDKAATAVKYRIALAISRGTFLDLDEKGEPTVKIPATSINQAEKSSAGTNTYKKFIEQRSFYKESYFNLAELREDITSFVNEIKDRIKSI